MKHIKEIEYYKKRAFLFIGFLEEQSEEKDSFILKQFQEIILKNYSSKNLNGLKACNNEINRWAKELPTEKLTYDFYKLLEKELNENYPKIVHSKLEEIKTKGIQNEIEYNIVTDRVNKIFNKKEYKLEIEKLNELLTLYEKH